MALHVVFRPQAEDEAIEAVRWYEARHPGLGRDFGREVDGLLTRIVKNPLAFPRVHHDTRRAVLPRFPYAVYFRVYGDLVVVLAVHGQQHPSRWKRRS